MAYENVRIYFTSGMCEEGEPVIVELDNNVSSATGSVRYAFKDIRDALGTIENIPQEQLEDVFTERYKPLDALFEELYPTEGEPMGIDELMILYGEGN